jgi:hypothetical protein
MLRFGNHRFLRAGTNIFVNTNGTDWVRTPRPTASLFESLTFGAGMFVATAGRDVATSVDGFNWIVRTNVLPFFARDVTFGNGVFLAVSFDTNTSISGFGRYFISQPVAEMRPTASPGELRLHGVRTAITKSWRPMI